MEVKQRNIAKAATNVKLKGDAAAHVSKAQGLVKEKKEKFSHFLYDREAGKVLGRTGMQWLRVAIFYIIFYTALFGLLAGMITIAKYHLVGMDKPNYYGTGSIIGDKAVLMVITPNAYKLSNRQNTTFIVDPKNFKAYLNDMRKELGGYTTMKEGQVNCDADLIALIKKFENPKNSSCFVNLGNSDNDTGFGSCSCKNVTSCTFGYNQSAPCIAVGFNKLIGWVPPGNDTGRVELICNTTSNTVQVTTYPAEGIPHYYFPYNYKVHHWYRPIYMVKLTPKNYSMDNTGTVRCIANSTGTMGELKIDYIILKRSNTSSGP